eukprot:g570.t1
MALGGHLLEVARVPLRLEKVLAFGFLLCFDILLHELSFMPLQVLCALLRQVFRTNRASRRAAPAVTITEKCDLIRLSLLLANVALQSIGLASAVQITSWLLLLVGIELGTDWVKFCLIMKFSELPVSVLENYQQVLIADLLVCRMPHTARDARPPSLPCMPFRGVQSFSHVVARRIGFSGLPLSTLVLSHLLHANLACQGPGVLLYLLLALILTLAKVLLSVLLLGLAARRRNSIARGLELFGKIKAL